MTISEVYDQFPINQGLREHMLRVGAVAKTICDNKDGTLDSEDIISAALLHDLGNILKFQFDREDMVELMQPEGAEYWQKKQAEVELEYGSEEDVATVMMLQKINVSPETIKVIDSAHLSELDKIVANNNLSGQVMLYCDMRVGPGAVMTLTERMQDMRDRYVTHRFTHEEMDEMVEKMKTIEENIFARCQIKPEEITEGSTASLQQALLDWEVA